jgi:hypothetical protein
VPIEHGRDVFEQSEGEQLEGRCAPFLTVEVVEEAVVAHVDHCAPRRVAAEVRPYICA